MSRRELLAALSATTGAAAVAGGSLAAPAAAAGGGDDTAQLRSLVALELTFVFAYERVLASGKLSGAAAQTATLALAQERSHAARLTSELRARGAAPPPQPFSVSAAERALQARGFSGSLTRLSSEGYCLRRLYDIEAIAVGAYYEALPKLADQRLLLTAAQIMGAEAQHAASVGALLHPGNIKRIVPLGFVAGKH